MSCSLSLKIPKDLREALKSKSKAEQEYMSQTFDSSPTTKVRMLLNAPEEYSTYVDTALSRPGHQELFERFFSTSVADAMAKLKVDSSGSAGSADGGPGR